MTTFKDTDLATYIDQGIYNGPYRWSFYRILGISPGGCPYRGTSACPNCEYSPPVLCDYRCQHRTPFDYEGTWHDCQYRERCPCGHDQTERLRAWGLVT